jgi:hypothetical protein
MEFEEIPLNCGMIYERYMYKPQIADNTTNRGLTITGVKRPLTIRAMIMMILGRADERPYPTFNCFAYKRKANCYGQTFECFPEGMILKPHEV